MLYQNCLDPEGDILASRCRNVEACRKGEGVFFFDVPEKGRRLADHRLPSLRGVDQPTGGADLNDASGRSALLLREFVRLVSLSATNGIFQELLTQYLALMRPLGVVHVSLVDVSRFATHSKVGLAFTTVPIEFVMRFARGGRWQSDPIWKASLDAGRVLRWSDVGGAEPGKPESFRIEGLADGLTVPVSHPQLGRPLMFLMAERTLQLDQTTEDLVLAASQLLASHAPRTAGSVGVSQRLTEREREVLRQTAAGRNAREIGNDLDMSEGTVARHLLNIRGKLDAANTVHAVAIALRQKLIPM